MAPLARGLGLLLVLLIPGGAVLLAVYFLGRAVHRTWRDERASVGIARLRRAVASVSLRQVWHDVRLAL